MASVKWDNISGRYRRGRRKRAQGSHEVGQARNIETPTYNLAYEWDGREWVLTRKEVKISV